MTGFGTARIVGMRASTKRALPPGVLRAYVLAHRALGLVDEVQRPALVEEGRRRGVQVFRARLPGSAVEPDRGALHAQDPAAEANRRAVLVADREDDPAAELVDDADAARLRAARRGESDPLQPLVPELALLDELAA